MSNKNNNVNKNTNTTSNNRRSSERLNNTTSVSGSSQSHRTSSSRHSNSTTNVNNHRDEAAASNTSTNIATSIPSASSSTSSSSSTRSSRSHPPSSSSSHSSHSHHKHHSKHSKSSSQSSSKHESKSTTGDKRNMQDTAYRQTNQAHVIGKLIVRTLYTMAIAHYHFFNTSLSLAHCCPVISFVICHHTCCVDILGPSLAPASILSPSSSPSPSDDPNSKLLRFHSSSSPSIYYWLLIGLLAAIVILVAFNRGIKIYQIKQQINMQQQQQQLQNMNMQSMQESVTNPVATVAATKFASSSLSSSVIGPPIKSTTSILLPPLDDDDDSDASPVEVRKLAELYASVSNPSSPPPSVLVENSASLSTSTTVASSSSSSSSPSLASPAPNLDLKSLPFELPSTDHSFERLKLAYAPVSADTPPLWTGAPIIADRGPAKGKEIADSQTDREFRRRVRLHPSPPLYPIPQFTPHSCI